MYLYNTLNVMNGLGSDLLETDNTDDIISKLVDIAENIGEKISFAAPFVLAGSFIAGAVLTAVILNRKEK